MNELAEYLIDVLSPLGKLSTRRMFGETCLFVNGQMFAIISADGDIFVKTHHLTDGDIPFTYQRQGRTITMRYTKIDNDLLDDTDMLIDVIRQKLHNEKS
ncbi:TfoX/Sxy family protein [uncultured Moraxella sp.]|uniref:TfoX/Sxy family protein n=1 Tax=uncultured Moraxella sp. TaxID=263769 RepID=UPI0025DEA12A|nr:TfoX/Sxy family protein [uncultured Moraxella sp.]